MGLEPVELVLEVEDQFGVSIHDAEAERALTVGDLHALVCRLTGATADGDLCRTRAAFHEVRRTLVALGVPRREVRPCVRTEDLLPGREARVAWEELRCRTGVALPPMRIGGAPGRIVSVLAIGGVVMLLFGLPVVSIAAEGWLWLLWLGGWVGCFVMAWIVARLARPYASGPPSTCETIGDLCRVLAVRDRRLPGPASAVFEPLRRIVAEVAGVPAERIGMNTRFVEDLGF